MKKPNPLIGYVYYDGIRFPFRFDEEKFTIMLFPPTEEAWAKTSAFEYVFQGLQFVRGHGWIQSLDLRGVTSERNMFCSMWQVIEVIQMAFSVLMCIGIFTIRRD